MNTIQNSLCVIPARGGSKRIPRKNVKDFLGKPIIAYSIEAAIDSGLFDEIMVSTDDQEIAELALKYGARVPFLRSEKTSDDFATTLDVLKEVIERYQSEGQLFNTVCCIYPCAPFVTALKLQNAHLKLIEGQFDVVFPVIEFSFPVQRALGFRNEKIHFTNPEFSQTRSQDLEPRYHDAGQFYFMKTGNTINKNRIITQNASAVVLSETEGQDIDSETDWILAELKYQIKTNDFSR